VIAVDEHKKPQSATEVHMPELGGVRKSLDFIDESL
jgi:hypothetical protein